MEFPYLGKFFRDRKFGMQNLSCEMLYSRIANRILLHHYYLVPLFTRTRKISIAERRKSISCFILYVVAGIINHSLEREISRQGLTTSSMDVVYFSRTPARASPNEAIAIRLLAINNHCRLSSNNFSRAKRFNLCQKDLSYICV